jgi:hypothetical protein
MLVHGVVLLNYKRLAALQLGYFLTLCLGRLHCLATWLVSGARRRELRGVIPLPPLIGLSKLLGNPTCRRRVRVGGTTMEVLERKVGLEQAAPDSEIKGTPACWITNSRIVSPLFLLLRRGLKRARGSQEAPSRSGLVAGLEWSRAAQDRLGGSETELSWAAGTFSLSTLYPARSSSIHCPRSTRLWSVYWVHSTVSRPPTPWVWSHPRGWTGVALSHS